MVGPGSRLGPYEIRSPLGAGGMGEVYKAHDPRLGREIAIKILPAEVSRDADRLKRFTREARTISALNHPNIVTIYEVGQEGDVAYLAMELVKGETLRELLLAGSLHVRRLLSIGSQIADGLANAHTAGIVHRDLKPENVMVTEDGFAKILDFGLAKQAERAGDGTRTPTQSIGTEAGVVLGTAGYMSPEQASGLAVDFRSDQFSLGAVLYEMATGKRAFPGDSTAAVLAAILRDEPEPIVRLNDKVPAPFVWVVQRCLAKDPADRYASSQDLANLLRDLREHISHGISAAVATAEPEASPRRRVRLAAFAVALALAAALGFLLSRPLWKRPLPAFQRISFRRGAIYQARFAADGRSVLYSAAWDGGPQELYEGQAGGADARPLGLAPAKLLAVSAGGELAIARNPSLVFSFFHPGLLARVPLAGGVPRDLSAGVNAADWTPDGRELVVARVTGSGAEQGMQVEWPLGTKVYELKLGRIGSLRVSPRGDRIAFFEYKELKAALVVLDRSGARRVLSSGWEYATFGLAWTPDEREIWFTATDNSGSPAKLWAVGLDGSRRLVLDVPGGLQLDDIAPDGRVLVTHSNLRLSLYVGGETAGLDRDLSWSGISTVNDLSTDGQRVLFADMAGPNEKNFRLLVRPADGGPALRLGDGFYQFGAQLSPDGKSVAALPFERLAVDMRIEPIGVGESRRLPRGDLDVILGSNWLPDSSGFILLGARAKQTPFLVEQHLDGSPPRPLAGRCDGNMVLSRDGRLIACVIKAGLAIHPRDGSSSREIQTNETPGNLIAWSADGRSIFSYRGGAMPGAILRTDLATGRVEVFKRLQPADPAGVWRIHPVVVTPDGRHWAYTASRWLSDLYVYSGLR